MDEDYRLIWMKDRVLTFLNEKDPLLFYDLLDRDDGKVRNFLRSFISEDILQDHGPDRRIIYFYKTFYDKIIEENIVVAEQVVVPVKAKEETPPPPPLKKKTKKKTKGEGKKGKSSGKDPAQDADAEEDIDNTEEVNDEVQENIEGPKDPEEETDKDTEADDTAPDTPHTKSGKKKKKVSEKLKKDKGKKSPRTAVETPPLPTEEPEYVYVTKVVEKVVQAPELHVHFGVLDGDSTPNNVFFVYFLRQQQQAIPQCDNYPDARSVMSNYFLIGSLKGRYLDTIHSLMKQVYIPVIEKQFREPETVLSWYKKETEKIDREDEIEDEDVTVFAKFMSLYEYHRFSSHVAKTQQDPEDAPTIYFRQCDKTIKSAPNKSEMPIKFQLLQELVQLSHSLEQTCNRLEDTYIVEVPSVDLNNIPDDEFESTMEMLKNVVMSWEHQITSELNNYKGKTPNDENPISEVQFWKEKSASLNVLAQQFQKPKSLTVLNIIGKNYSSMLSSFTAKQSELEDCLKKARENEKFLSTISRNLKAISASDSFEKISEILPKLVSGLHLIWLLSRYFNTDDAMVSFMKRISWLLSYKVSSTLTSETIFKNPFDIIVNQTMGAKTMLQIWKKCYLDTRLKIEVTGMGKRWEFDQIKLFSNTEYIASVCSDLHDMAVVIREFMNVFGPEFKAMIKDPPQVDSIVKRIENLALGVEMTDFDIYKPSCRDNWRAVVDAFYKDVKILEREVRIFIDQAFMMLKSSEDALEMLLKFKSCETRKEIKLQLSKKFDVIMQEFLKEIELKQECFNRSKKKPPILRYQPPESGAIFWERLLFTTLKKPILRFQKVEELKDSPYRTEAFNSYVAVAKQMKEYEKMKFEQWCKKVLPLCSKALQKPLLKLENIVTEQVSFERRKSKTATQSQHAKTSSRGSVNSLNVPGLNLTSAALAIRWKGKSTVSSHQVSTIAHTKRTKSFATFTELDENLVLSDLNMKLLVNFSDDVFDIIAEAELMEYLGFSIPSPIHNLALQKERLYKDLRSVTNMMEEYNNVINNLSREQLLFTKDLLRHVENNFQAGQSRLNWSSLGIEEYVKNCNAALKTLASVVYQTKRIEYDLEKRVSTLKDFNLFATNQFDGKVIHEIKEFFTNVDSDRTKTVQNMIQIYSGVGPILIKLESLVKHSNSGMCASMSLFYSSWERRIFQTMVETLLSNLREFDKALNSSTAMFEVSAILSLPDVILQPPPTILHNLIVNSAIDCVERFKLFPKWQHNSCLEDEQVSNNELHLSSFYNDIVGEEEVGQLMKQIQGTTLKLTAECERKLVLWKKYARLWTTDMQDKCDRFASRDRSLSDYDEKFSFYTMVMVELEEMEPHENIQCVRLNWQPMITTVRKLCHDWKSALGQRLAETTKADVNAFRQEIIDLTTQLNKPILSLDNFKEVLQTVATIKKITISSEIKYEEFQEVYHVLALHKIETNADDIALAQTVKQQWQQLYMSSLYRCQQLQPTRERFAAMSLEEITAFVAQLNKFIESYRNEGLESESENLDRALLLADRFSNDFDKFDEKRQELLTAEALFDLPPADYSEYLHVRNEFQLIRELIHVYESLKTFQGNCARQLWLHLNPQSLIPGVDSLMSDFKKLGNKIIKYPIGIALEKKLKEFKILIPLMIDLKSDSLLERHWKMLMDKTGISFELAADKFTLENLFRMEIYRFPGIVEEITASAEREMEIEINVKEIVATWQKTNFNFAPHDFLGEQRGFVLCDVSNIVSLLEENSVTLQGMASSPFIGPFLGAVGKLEKNLSLIGDVLDEWMQVQKNWIYLEGIFIGGDIKTQLPEEAQRFNDIDMSFQRIMTDVSKRPNVKECCETQGRLIELQGLQMGLNKCQKSLNEYLETKRNIFPRFFFISDDELLSVLGSVEPTAIQPHIIKMFDNVIALRFAETPNSITVVTAMISCEKEIMDFQQEILTEGRVEDWLRDVENQMRLTNRFMTKRALYDYGKVVRPRAEWLLDHLGMVCLASNQVWWTAEVEDTFGKIAKGKYSAMKLYLNQLNQQISDLVICVQAELTRNDRKKYNTVLIVDVHSRDIVESFVRNGVVNAREFEWESQLRSYWKKDVDDLVIEQCTGTFSYGYEYLGLSGRLVITPLTDRIYLTVTQALSMHLGAAPAGPAGTGKTETIKDLAKVMGLLCVVTNCGEGMDYKSIGKLLNGLCQCGAWGCFDEFNRIDVAVLSVVSSQLQAIRHALILRMKRFNFDEQEISLDKKVGIFVTMNPGYAGRTELPESVKALFRPVVCVVPDFEMISLIMLLSEGFLQAKVLAKKMTVLYNLSREQLSKQHHYDFGLRALKSVLTVAGELRRNSKSLDEETVLMRALRDMNLPKLVFEDVPLFLGLVSDLFPGVECDSLLNEKLSDAIENVLGRDNYDLVPYQIEKVVQLRETMNSRHSTMLVGPSGGGKSVIIQTLKKSQELLGIPTTLHTLNPKAYSLNKLYGILDPKTRDWNDGLLSALFREANRELESDSVTYIVFDGDIDALWVEDMNSVMDDNKLLTLPNGERIRLQPHCALIFEVGDLTYASPATVSRAGMVYVDPKNMNFASYWKRWIHTYKEDEELQQILNTLYDKYVEAISKFVTDGWNGVQQGLPLNQIVPQTNLNMLTQLCNIITGTLPKKSQFVVDDGRTLASNDKEVIEALFIQALFLSFGASLLEESRRNFDDFVKKISGFLLVSDTSIKKAGPRFLPISEKTLYEYFFDVENKFWTAWKWIVPGYVHQTDLKFSNILVPTLDTKRADWLIQIHRDIKQPLLFIGETGTSKSAIVLNYFRSLEPNLNHQLIINFSARTTSHFVQRNIESAAEKRTKYTFGPPIGTKLVIFIDDLNTPRVDKYGTQQPIAFLKLLFERGGFFDIEKDFNWINLMDCVYLAAMGKPGGGRASVDPRYLCKFSIIHASMPTDETIIYIYKSILSGHAETLSDHIKTVVTSLVEMTLSLLHEVIKELAPTPTKFHYVFNLRDLSRITAGLCQIKPVYFKTAEKFIRAWRNEFTRVIGDRLISEDDQILVNKKIKEKVTENFEDYAEVILREPLLFGDFRNACREGEVRYYEDLLDYDAVYFLFQEILEVYTESGEQLQMVLFQYAIEHLTRIHRVLRMDKGHMMIVGVGGSGKKTMTKLAAFAADCRLFQITLTRGYGILHFQEDIKRLYSQCGIENKPTVFLVNAGQILDDAFLEIVNNILAVGVDSSMFVESEKEEIISSMREEAEKAGWGSKKERVWSYFCNRCCENLHVILTMTPLGDDLRIWCRNFPRLVSCSTINWLFPWPTEAFHSLAEAFLAENPEVPEQFRPSCVDLVVHVHSSLDQYTSTLEKKNRRKNYVTPKQFLSYISQFLIHLKAKNSDNSSQIYRLSKGIDKIVESRQELDRLGEFLTIQKAAADAKTVACEELLEVIKTATDNATEKKIIATKKKNEIEEQEKIISFEQAETTEILEKALPALEAAKSALNDLDKSDITEIRSFTTPPQAVQTVCECLLHLLGVKDISWKSAKALMADPYFLLHLKEMNCDQITLTQQRLCKAHAKNLPPDLKASSTAAHGLMMYVHAVLSYCAVYREIKPKREKVEKLAQDNLTAQEFLLTLQSEIENIEAQLHSLQNEHQKAMLERKVLNDETNLMQKRLISADKLMVGLNSECKRWSLELKTLTLQKDDIIGNALLATAFLTYCGPFTQELRYKMVHADWKTNIMNLKIPMNSEFQLSKELSSEVEISKWSSQGLPADELSVQNGILTIKGTHFPFCIDPQQQALTWIRKREEKTLKITSFNSPDYLMQLEMSIKYGSSILFENVEDFVDPLIEDVLERNYRVKGGRTFVLLSGKDIEVDSKFRLYLTTKFSNPKLNPAIYAKATVINYTVTEEGLKEQLLGFVVQSERPDLEETRDLLIKDISLNRSLLQNLEDSLLRELSSATGNMLDNDDLINVLENSKSNAEEVSKQLVQNEKTTIDIEQLRGEYEIVARRGSVLYFALCDMTVANFMYQYSLGSFLEVFLMSMRNASPDSDLTNRLPNIITELTKNIYEFGCLGMFERHKLLFSFQITLKIQQCEGNLNASELDFFLRGKTSLEKYPTDNPYSWLNEDSWQALLHLSLEFPTSFGNIIADIAKEHSHWFNWTTLETPETASYPCGYTVSLSPFQQMMLLRCFRMDRLYRGIIGYVSIMMGEEYVISPAVTIMNIYRKTAPLVPVIFILSAGSDPVHQVLELADECGMTGGKFKYTSLGQGQDATALTMLDIAINQGQWLMLQNCHLLIPLMGQIEAILKEQEKPHPDFRLWLTSEPTPKFPINILQRSLKVVTEPPSGIKANLLNSISKLAAVNVESCMHHYYKPFAYVLAFFHAVVQERRKYGKSGWNISYDFNDADFNVSLDILKTYLSKCSHEENVPWESLKYLIGEVIYGGRVIDNFDRRIVQTYMDEYFGDFLCDSFQPFYFHRDESYDYKVNYYNDFSEYVNHIRSMPSANNPEIIGLHSNAAIGYYTDRAKDLCVNLIDMQPGTTEEDGSSTRSEKIDGIAQDILLRTPATFDLSQIRKTYEMKMTPTTVVLIQELERFNLLIENIANSLHQLRRALLGEEEMNATLDNISQSLLNGKIPVSWRMLYSQTKMTLGAWLAHFERRGVQYSTWVHNGEPIVVWLSGLHVPQAFLTALIQMACRANGWALDRSTLYTEVSEQFDADDVESGLYQGCYIEGLFLEGAQWNVTEKCLERSSPKILMEPLPILKVIPIEKHQLKLQNTIKTPIYTTSDRRNAMGEGLVFEADLSTKQHPSHWILQGVCLLLNKD